MSEEKDRIMQPFCICKSIYSRKGNKGAVVT